jgi:hypothetical protein
VDNMKIKDEKELREVLKNINRLRYVYAYDLNSEEFDIKDKVLRKAYLTNSKGEKLFAIKMYFGYGETVRYYQYDDLTNHSVTYNEYDECISLKISNLLFLFTAEPIVESITINDGIFDINLVERKKEAHDMMNGFIHSALYRYKDNFIVDFEPKENVTPLKEFSEFEKILPELRKFKYISVMTELPEKKVGWLNTGYKGYHLEEMKHQLPEEMDKELIFFNDVEYPHKDKPTIKNWNTCNIYISTIEFNKYNAFMFTSLLKDKHSEFCVIYMANTLFIFHNSKITELDLIKVKSNLYLEFKYNPCLPTKIRNGETTIIMPDLETDIFVDEYRVVAIYDKNNCEIIEVNDDGIIKIEFDEHHETYDKVMGISSSRKVTTTKEVKFDELKDVFVVDYPKTSIVLDVIKDFDELLQLWS